MNQLGLLEKYVILDIILTVSFLRFNIVKDTIEIMKVQQMNEYAMLNFEIIISLLLFSIDPEIVSQGRLIEMRRNFTNMVNIVEEESQR